MIHSFSLTRKCLLILLLLLATVTVTAAQEVIIFTRPDGGVSIVGPAPNCVADLQQPAGSMSKDPGRCPALGYTRAQALEWIRQKDVPPDAINVRMGVRSELPPSRRFRNAWRDQNGIVVEEIAEARSIRLKQLEQDIDRKIVANETVARQHEDTGNMAFVAAARAYRNQLRSLRSQLPTALAPIATPEALAAWTPTYPLEPVP